MNGLNKVESSRLNLDLAELAVMNITANPIDTKCLSPAPYPEGMRGGRVNTNIGLLGLALPFLIKKPPSGG